ncbi:acetyl esterase/lipase [Haloferula luteola]|uniref:Acetyl esterase/lipase n=1 Tax=Haloferula luteola TaxID=595692 RepID=A0A840V326_9BACT|nr:alpha/beta hydrolase fold domain-containing protein [Haloferula luteola]MBB5352395.1 acetyl esterase/lipase [Haloferula luteola]
MRGSLLSLLSLLLTLPALAQQDPFSHFDTNRNGRIEADELPAEARPFLGMVDLDQDGALSREEFDRVAANLQKWVPQEPENHATDFQNIDYVGNGHTRQTLDLYLPDQPAEKALPLLVYIHGGGWMSGTKQEGLGVAEILTATRQYAVASINYRLIQDALWPAQLDDCKAAIRFLRAHADTYGIDPDRIAVMGSSAGGHLATLLGTTSGEKSQEGAIGAFPTTSSKVKAVVDFFGPSNFETFYGEDVDFLEASRSSLAVRLLGTSDEEILRNARRASPTTWISPQDPPVFIAHGTRDTIVPFAQSAELETKLKAAGIEAHLIAIEGAGHGFASPELNRRVKAFLDRHLRGQSQPISTEPIPAR